MKPSEAEEAFPVTANPSPLILSLGVGRADEARLMNRRAAARRRRLGLEAAAAEEGHGRSRELRGDEANPAKVKWRRGGGRRMALRGEARVSRGGV